MCSFFHVRTKKAVRTIFAIACFWFNVCEPRETIYLHGCYTLRKYDFWGDVVLQAPSYSGDLVS